MGLMIFIIIQCLVLDDIIFLHIIYFGFGFIEVLLALIIEYKQAISNEIAFINKYIIENKKTYNN